MDLEKTVLITGGSSGIGLHLAGTLLRTRARVIVVADQPARLAAAVEELSAISPLVSSVVCDIGDRESVRAMHARVTAEFGCPDILINNAGFATYKTFDTLSLEEIEALVSVNLVGAMRCTRVFLDQMIARRSGAIVNMASIAGRIVITPNGTYTAAKHGLVAWSDTLRYEVAPLGLQVNVICPGRVETPFFDHESFKNRAHGPETRYTISLEDVTRATLRAIVTNRPTTHVPRSLGALVWVTRALPVLVSPFYGWLFERRRTSSSRSPV